MATTTMRIWSTRSRVSTWKELCAMPDEHGTKSVILGDVLVRQIPIYITGDATQTRVYHKDGDGFRIINIDGAQVIEEHGEREWSIFPRKTTLRQRLLGAWHIILTGQPQEN